MLLKSLQKIELVLVCICVALLNCWRFGLKKETTLFIAFILAEFWLLHCGIDDSLFRCCWLLVIHK